MHQGKIPLSDSKEYPPGSLMEKLKKRKIIATLAAFVGSGIVIIEVAHHILVNHYHLPHQIVDICIVTLAGSLIGTLIWQWFREAEKRAGNVKVEVLVVPLVALLTLAVDLKFIFVMTGVSVNILIVGFVALFLGIAWVLFKSLQWAAGPPEAEKKAKVLKPVEEKPITFPEWEKSIVVLPFENISPDSEQDYFCDGMTEEITSELSKIHNLLVISRNSAMTYKGSKKKTKEIGEELDVQYVLEGSVRKAGDNLRITVQLIDARSDIHLWSEKYNGSLDDVFDIQEKVARCISKALKLKLSSDDNKRMAVRPLEDAQAYECYLRSRHEVARFTEKGLERALHDLQNGLDIVGENALLYAGMANVYFTYFDLGFRPTEETLQNAKDYTMKVLELKPDSPQGHFLLGRVERSLGSAVKAIGHFKKAFDIDPNNPETLQMLSLLCAMHAGKVTEAREFLNLFKRIDPLFPNYSFIYIQLLEKRLDLAIDTMQKIYEMEPDNIIMKYWFSVALALNRQYEDAIDMIDQVVKESSSEYIRNSILFFKYALLGDKDLALKTMTGKTLRFCWNDPEFPAAFPGLYVLLNEKEEAYKWLERAVERGIINYPLFNELDPFLENIRGEERFKKLMKRVKHEWENFEV